MIDYVFMKTAPTRLATKGSASGICISIVCILVMVGFIVFVRAGYNSITHHTPNWPLRAITSLEQAVNAFYTEYGQLPDVGSRVKTDSPEGIKLLAVLLGLEDPSGVVQNKRGINFLSVRSGSDRKNGLILSPDKRRPEGLYDRWGNPYTVFLDVKNEEKLHFEIAGRPVDLDGRRVAAISPGQDNKLGTPDDVTSW